MATYSGMSLVYPHQRDIITTQFPFTGLIPQKSRDEIKDPSRDLAIPALSSQSLSASE
jgi:hypothetical protein